MHLNTILEYGLDRNSVCKDFLRTAENVKKYKTKYYNLDAIILTSCNVNKKRGIGLKVHKFSFPRKSYLAPFLFVIK